MTGLIREELIEWAEKYNDPAYFQCDPIAFPREFVNRGAGIRDIETAAVFAAHFAWGRREMIVRDCERLFDHMEWKPFDYVNGGDWRDDPVSIHRTIKWSETAQICKRLKSIYDRGIGSLADLSAAEFRTLVFGQKDDPKAPNKKIWLMKRWLTRNDGKVDLGVWSNAKASELVIPLDVHVYSQAVALGLTHRKSKDLGTALEITDAFRGIWPDDPVKGDFALFGYGVTHKNA